MHRKIIPTKNPVKQEKYKTDVKTIETKMFRLIAVKIPQKTFIGRFSQHFP